MPAPSALYATAALRMLERRARTQAGIAEDTLMRRAGQAGWRCLLRHWPEAQRILVLAGPGNNGGDGWVLAQHARESGRDVCVLTVTEDAPRTPLAREMADAYRQAGGRSTVFDGALPETEVVVDALFGIGLKHAPEGDARRLIEAANARGLPILALDVPSGVDADNGAVLGVAIRATRTLQFIAEHVGLTTGAALDHVGVAMLASLEVPAACFDGVEPAAVRLPAPRWPRRPRDSHKGRFGHVLAVGGEHGMGGAIVIAAEAALRSGAGRVSVATRAAQVAALLVRRPEAMGHALDDPAALRPLLADADALVVGPGLGQGAWGRGLFAAAMDGGQPCVVDADALGLLAEAPRVLPPTTVLTPHPGEAARLLGSATSAVQADRHAAVQALVDRYGCVLVLKGAGSIVAAPGRTPRVLGLGNPGMASAGMGDALAGVIASLLAQGHDAFEAASAGAWLHARAGDLAAASGEAGVLAGDLIRALPAAIAECVA